MYLGRIKSSLYAHFPLLAVVLNTLTPTKTSAAALVRRIFEKHKVEREEQKKAYPARKANVASALSSNLGGNASFPVRTAEGPKRMRGVSCVFCMSDEYGKPRSL